MNEKSIILKRYKKKHGRENQFFITSYIGIDLINEDTKKPENLSTSWKPKNIDNSKNESKLYIKRASLVYSVSSFESYVTDAIVQLFSHTLTLEPEVITVFQSEHKSVYKKIEVLVETYPELKNKDYYLTITGIFWRNNQIHNQKKKLEPSLKANLRNFTDSYYEKNSGLIIEDLISHFNTFEVPSFKEVLSIMAAVRNFAETIDAFFMKKVDNDKYIEYNLMTLYDEGKIKNLDNGHFNWSLFFETHLAVKDSIFRQAKICSELSEVKNYEELKEIISSIRHKYEKEK